MHIHIKYFNKLNIIITKSTNLITLTHKGDSISLESGNKYFRKNKICLEKRAYGLNEIMISRLYHENNSK